MSEATALPATSRCTLERVGSIDAARRLRRSVAIVNAAILLALVWQLVLAGGSRSATPPPSQPSSSTPSGSSGSPSSQDTTFATTNGQTNLAEIALDPIVQAQTQSPSLRSLADKLRDDHIKALAELRAAAGSAGARVPSAPSTMQQSQARMLRNTSTGEFEGMYLQTQALAHRMSIAATRTEISSGRSPALVAYARTYLPVAQMHLGMLNEAIVATGGPTQGQQTVATQVAPPGPSSSTAVVSSGQFAHGAKERPGSTAPWLIGLAIVVVVALLGFGARLLHRARGSH